MAERLTDEQLREFTRDPDLAIHRMATELLALRAELEKALEEHDALAVSYQLSVESNCREIERLETKRDAANALLRDTVPIVDFAIHAAAGPVYSSALALRARIDAHLEHPMISKKASRV